MTDQLTFTAHWVRAHVHARVPSRAATFVEYLLLAVAGIAAAGIVRALLDTSASTTSGRVASAAN